MKKMINLAFIYSIVAMVAGVFYREFTKLNGFVGVTSLGKMHVHLLVLGTIFFLILGLYCDRTKVQNQKGFNKALITYNVGLCWMVVMMLVRGITEVLNTPLSSGMSAAISGIAGIGHIILGVGIVLIFLKLKKAATE
ncbi:DUF2871 domain-containing protein [Anaerorhabdus furcosa]|uniref:DUF2871 domain-containing protein n=1 Tax=Anaerorhabdus furcosa TaxID=118967 RepID=A0A1T4KQT8_9FIRM|nr:DUF2871 domain-containing protein [Anaerorhabdus furcosa]SJZ44775.1 Protein of unknown function [Anaerorhabdus furcosa]